MLDYRAVDKFLAVGTHGNGIYTTTVHTNYTGIQENKKDKSDLMNVVLFPNPVKHNAHLSFHCNQEQMMQIELYNVEGKRVQTVFNGYQNTGQHKIDIEMNHLPAGIYHLQLKGQGLNLVKSIVKQ